MKKCDYCGKEFQDETEICPFDGKRLLSAEARTVYTASDHAPASRDSISTAEQRFWERMTFRQFAILIIRLQSLWLLFYAAVDCTYLVRYMNLSSSMSVFASLTYGSRIELGMLLFRIVMHVAAAIFLIQRAESVLSWLVKDSVAAAPRESAGA